jgi:hypothetical protein
VAEATILRECCSPGTWPGGDLPASRDDPFRDDGAVNVLDVIRRVVTFWFGHAGEPHREERYRRQRYEDEEEMTWLSNH